LDKDNCTALSLQSGETYNFVDFLDVKSSTPPPGIKFTKSSFLANFFTSDPIIFKIGQRSKRLYGIGHC